MNGIISKKLIVSVSFLLVLTMLLITASVAWLAFYYSDIDGSEIGGKLLMNYFHSGTGTAADPFIITRPVHYYNLVNLYQRVSDYSDKDYYFQIGLEGLNENAPNETYVYNYDDNGNVREDDPYSTELNLAYYSGGNALLPIGTHDKNFLGHFNGNGLTVSNFTVSTLADEKDCDIGIFGYVGPEADICNIYFSNVTIDLSNVSSADEVINNQSSGQNHNSSVHKNGGNKAYVGYLAGHVMTNSQFTEVYVNNVTIAGGEDDAAATSGFGYFGCIENIDGTLVQALGEMLPQLNAYGIGMDEIYGRLTGYRDTAQQTSFIESKKIWENGDLTEEFDQTYSHSVIRELDTNSTAGSFSFSTESENGDDNTVYLTGKENMTQSIITYTVTPNNNGFYLTSASGNTYLRLNDEKNGYATTTIANEATVWACDGENGNGRYFTTEIDDANHTCTYYYISANGITTSDSEATSWTYSSSGLYYVDANNVTRYLAFYGEEIVGSLGQGAGGVLPSVIKSGNNYLAVDTSKDNKVGTTTNPALAAVFTPEGEYYKTTSGGTTYYLASNNGLKLSADGAIKTTWSVSPEGKWVTPDGKQISFENNDWTLVTVQEVLGHYLRRNTGGHYYYLHADINTMTVTVVDTTNEVVSGETVWSIPEKTGYIYTIISGETYYLVAANANSLGLVTEITSQEMSEWTRGGSYYWLNSYTPDGNARSLALSTDNKSWYLKVGTTGASIGNNGSFSMGSTSGNGESQEISTIPGSIAKQENKNYYTVSSEETTNTVEYPIDTWFPILADSDGTPASNNFGYIVSGMKYRVDGLYQSGDIWITKGLDTSGEVIVADSVYHSMAYSSAKSDFDEYLSSQNSICGLCFKGPTTNGIFDIVTIPSATVGGTTYTYYQLPRSCVDFTMENDGYLNLFAGSYFSGASAFFKLYEITRNENGEIDDIFEKGTIGSGVENISEGLYYFQIPLDAGEYALGSAGGDNDAYLLYMSTVKDEEVLATGTSLPNGLLNVDVRSNGDDLPPYSLLQFAINAPGVSSDEFSVSVSFDSNVLNSDYSNGLYTISVVNQTGNPIGLTVYLCDNDNNHSNDYPYAYKIIDSAGDPIMNGAKDYFKGCTEVLIP